LNKLILQVQQIITAKNKLFAKKYIFQCNHDWIESGRTNHMVKVWSWTYSNLPPIQFSFHFYFIHQFPVRARGCGGGFSQASKQFPTLLRYKEGHLAGGRGLKGFSLLHFAALTKRLFYALVLFGRNLSLIT